MDADSQSLRELLRTLIRSMGLLEKSDEASCDITLAQCHALVEIGRRETLSLVALSELLHVDKSTMSRTVDSLVNADLVIRAPDADNRRYVSLTLTPKGFRHFTQVETSMRQYYQAVFNRVPIAKRAQVLESLQLLNDAFSSLNSG